MSGLTISSAHPSHLDSFEIDILNQRGAFHLPPKPTCDKLVDIFFKWIAPVLPVVDKHAFMRKYNNPGDSPSILLLQAIFMTASRFHTPENLDSSVSPRSLYKKAKALYDAGYELNEIPTLQAVVLMGIYWDGPDDLTENGLFYWSRLGIVLAQAYGLHQREKNMHLDRSEKQLRKRIWWTLYTRDRAVAAAFGRPLHIDLADCTIGPLLESDFVEYDEGSHLEHLPDKLHVRFFMRYIKLCQLMEVGLCLKLSSRLTQAGRATKAAYCELGLNEWLESCPVDLYWRQSRHNFWSAVLYSTFNAIICQIHLLQAPYSPEETRTSAFHAASTIISIMETLQSNEQLQYSPSFIICHALVSFATLKSQINASVPSLLHTVKLKLDANRDVLRELSRTWPIASFFLELFQTIVNQGQFDRALSLAVEGCRKRAHGDEKADSRPRPTKAFKRTMTRQVVLPENRLILQVLQTGFQKRSSSPPRPYKSASTNQKAESMPSGESDNSTSNALGELGFSWDNADPSIVLQNMREFSRTGELNAHGANGFR